ncbi:glycosyltransferase family 39 protein [Paenibacillus sp. GYB003]|uniref:glycosyltransferase family 39 protein n=1 Tax=Paenibacillus sp. GYB003 TaxID=2994392 RepID=UPI002F9663D7
MYRLYMKWKDRDFVYWIPLALFALTVKFRYFFFLLRSGQGIPQSPDSDWYLAYARSLMANFRIGLNMDDLMYAGYNLLLTLLLAVFKDPVAVVFVQVLTAGLSVILVYQIARMLFGRTTAVLASLFYGYSWDITLWSTYILTDSFFIDLLLLCVFFLLKSYESGKTAYKALFVATSFYMFIFRPTGVMTLFFILVYIVVRTDKQKLAALFVRYRLVAGGALAVAAAALTIALAGGKLDPLVESLQINAKKVLYNMYANGWIYDKPSDQDYHFEPDFTVDIGGSVVASFFVHNWNDILVLYGKRTIAFLGRWVWEIGTGHGIGWYARHILPVVLFAAGTAAAAMNGLFRKASVVWLVTLAVFLFCLVFFIDGLYRYKAPAIPFVAMAAAYGADRIGRGLVVFAKKTTGMLLWNKEKY